MLTTHVALLRGINVGGNNKLPMKDLARTFADAGCLNIRTYIQSGNVVFDADGSLVDPVADRITSLIAERFGLRIPVLLRTGAELADAIGANPFLGTVSDERALHVLFLADEPEAHRVAALDPDRSSPDAFVVRGREVYLWLPNGAARTKLTTGYFDSRLATTSTARNWRTVVNLHDLVCGRATK